MKLIASTNNKQIKYTHTLEAEHFNHDSSHNVIQTDFLNVHEFIGYIFFLPNKLTCSKVTRKSVPKSYLGDSK